MPTVGPRGRAVASNKARAINTPHSLSAQATAQRLSVSQRRSTGDSTKNHSGGGDGVRVEGGGVGWGGGSLSTFRTVPVDVSFLVTDRTTNSEHGGQTKKGKEIKKENRSLMSENRQFLGFVPSTHNVSTHNAPNCCDSHKNDVSLHQIHTWALILRNGS